jgi:hypothetical protein
MDEIDNRSLVRPWVKRLISLDRGLASTTLTWRARVALPRRGCENVRAGAVPGLAGPHARDRAQLTSAMRGMLASAPLAGEPRPIPDAQGVPILGSAPAFSLRERVRRPPTHVPFWGICPPSGCGDRPKLVWKSLSLYAPISKNNCFRILAARCRFSIESNYHYAKVKAELSSSSHLSGTSDDCLSLSWNNRSGN